MSDDRQPANEKTETTRRAKADRRVVRRGSKLVEVDAAPNRETR
jgi:hypothetical protein